MAKTGKCDTMIRRADNHDIIMIRQAEGLAGLAERRRRYADNHDIMVEHNKARRIWKMKMRKRVAHLALLLALAALLAGCGAIVVEDAQPVRIGSIVHRNL